MDSIQNNNAPNNNTTPVDFLYEPIAGVKATRGKESKDGSWEVQTVTRDDIQVGDDIMFSSEQSFHANIDKVRAVLAQRNLALAPKKLPTGKTRAQWTQVTGFPVTRVAGVSKKSGRPYAFYKAWVCSLNQENQSTF